MTKNITFTHWVVRLTLAKELFSSEVVGKWTLSTSTRIQSHYFAISVRRQGHAQPGREIKTVPVMQDAKFLTLHHHAASPSLDGEWVTWNSWLHKNSSDVTRGMRSTQPQCSACSAVWLVPDICSQRVRNKQASAFDAALYKAQNEVNSKAEHDDRGSDLDDTETWTPLSGHILSRTKVCV